MVVAFTDGLVERRTEPIDVGFGRLMESVSRRSHLPVTRLCDLVMGDLTDREDQRDDVALVAARLLAIRKGNFHRQIDPDPNALSPLRHSFAGWLLQETGDEEQGELLVLALSEAVSNSIEHAYRSQKPAPIDIDANSDGDLLKVVISDKGRWKASPPDHWRGRGLDLIREIVDDVRIDTDTFGTRVTMECRLLKEPV
jgi:serine/threonine-protein kinase RsbW